MRDSTWSASSLDRNDIQVILLSLPPPLVKAHQTQAPLCGRGQCQGLLCSQSLVEGRVDRLSLEPR